MPLTRLAFAGDVMLGRLVDKALDDRGVSDPWRAVLPLLSTTDAFVYNLECAICEDLPQWSPREKPFHFRLPPELSTTLLESTVDAVQIANNHIMDHGAAGLIETIEALDDMGIPHAGAGSTLKRAMEPAVFVARTGARIALVCATDHPREWGARADSPGVFLIDVMSEKSLEHVREAIGAARDTGPDVVVLGLHWGPNMRRIPPPSFRAFARAAVEAGADVVWGTSAHLFQGIEFLPGGLVLYDTGDFLDDYAIDRAERNDLSFLFIAEVDGSRTRYVELVPVAIEDRRIRRANEDETGFVGARMKELCEDFDTTIEKGPHDRWLAMPQKPHAPLAA